MISIFWHFFQKCIFTNKTQKLLLKKTFFFKICDSFSTILFQIQTFFNQNNWKLSLNFVIKWVEKNFTKTRKHLKVKKEHFSILDIVFNTFYQKQELEMSFSNFKLHFPKTLFQKLSYSWYLKRFLDIVLRSVPLTLSSSLSNRDLRLCLMFRTVLELFVITSEPITLKNGLLILTLSWFWKMALEKKQQQQRQESLLHTQTTGMEIEILSRRYNLAAQLFEW